MKFRYKRRNWFMAMGILFIVVSCISIIRDILIWSPEFVADYFTSADINSEKISATMIAFGTFLFIFGYKKGTNENI